MTSSSRDFALEVIFGHYHNTAMKFNVTYGLARSRDSIGGKVTGYGLDDGRGGVLVLAGL